MTEPLRIVVINSDLQVDDPQDTHAVDQAERSRSLRIGLLENGFNLVASLPADVFLTERLAQLQPDLIIVDAESDARDALEHVVMATRDARRPIVMFTNDNDSGNARAAVAAGVSAYIVAGLQAERVEVCSRDPKGVVLEGDLQLVVGSGEDIAVPIVTHDDYVAAGCRKRVLQVGV